MVLTDAQAEAIALLLNTRNELTVQYDSARVIADADDYLCRSSHDGELVACVQVKKVQWYQCEVLHLTVAKSFERKGHAKDLLADAESLGRRRSARLLQCTIRSNNTASQALFERCGYTCVNAFLNEVSGNTIQVWQKALVVTP